MSLLKEGTARGTVLPTKQAVKHTIDGVTEIYPVYRIQISELYYNNHNDRIATWLSKWRADNGGADPITLPRDEYNDIIEGFIVDSNTDAIRSTQRNIATFGQRVPGVVLSDGLVIDGNRRLTCIRRNAAEKNEVGWFEAAILPDEIASEPKRIKLLELSIQHGEEGKVDYDPIERLVGVYNDIIKDGLLTKAEYARSTGMKEADVQKFIDQAGYMRDFLEFCNAPEQYHLARELAIAGPLGEISSILRKCKYEYDRQRVKDYIFANILVQTEGDITRLVRRFKQVVGTNDEKEFYGDEQTAFQRLIPAMGEEPITVNKVKTIRANDAIRGNFTRAIEKADKKVKLGKLANAPSTKTKDALADLRQIMPSMLMQINKTELRNVRYALEQIRDEAQRLINEVDKLA